jgi:hypothetical protein
VCLRDCGMTIAAYDRRSGSRRWLRNSRPPIPLFVDRRVVVPQLGLELRPGIRGHNVAQVVPCVGQVASACVHVFAEGRKVEKRDSERRPFQAGELSIREAHPKYAGAIQDRQAGEYM